MINFQAAVAASYRKLLASCKERVGEEQASGRCILYSSPLLSPDGSQVIGALELNIKGVVYQYHICIGPRGFFNVPAILSPSEFKTA